MKQHRYEVTLKHVADPKGEPPAEKREVAFEARNHDDIFSIIEKIKAREDFNANDSAAFAVGLKLFSEIMLENRDHPLFAEFRPHFVEFMKTLKGKGKKQEA